MKIFVSILFILSSVFAYSQKISNGFYEENEEINLYAFIGQKISIEEFDPNLNNKVTTYDSITKQYVVTTSYISDRAFIATYKIIEPVFNKLPGDTIQFKVYDHYGRPDFENYDQVVLYISKNDNGSYYHQKYQFDPVFKDKQGNWMGIYVFRNVMDLDDLNSNYIKVDTGNQFDKDISSYNKEYIEIIFPKPFYEIKNNIARPVMGAGLTELFKIKKENAFKAPGLFK